MSTFRIFILRVQWWLFGRASVVLVDHDGQLSARLVHGPETCRYAKRYEGGRSQVRLLPNGRTSGKIFVPEWTPLFGEALPAASREGGENGL
jgi:hypothetical protein